MEEMQELPWYRQFWPWFIMSIPAASVVGGLLTFYLAGGEPSMVVDDYGRIAMVTAQRAARDERAEQLGLNARLSFTGTPDQGIELTTVSLKQGIKTGELPGSLLLQLIHPTRSEMDRSINLAGSDGIYAGRLERPPGRYYISISDPDETWRLTGNLSAGTSALELQASGQDE
jgi:hypothetical protein